MSRGWAVVAALLSLGATGAQARCTQVPDEVKMTDQKGRSIRIEETTVRTIDGWMVTVANVMKGKWKTPDGREREGLSAVVGLYDEKKAEKGEQTVGDGAVLTINGKKWRVVGVVAGKGAENGSIEIQEISH